MTMRPLLHQLLNQRIYVTTSGGTVFSGELEALHESGTMTLRDDKDLVEIALDAVVAVRRKAPVQTLPLRRSDLDA